jgi:hypothetical protein
MTAPPGAGGFNGGGTIIMIGQKAIFAYLDRLIAGERSFAETWVEEQAVRALPAALAPGIRKTAAAMIARQWMHLRLDDSPRGMDRSAIDDAAKDLAKSLLVREMHVNREVDMLNFKDALSVELLTLETLKAQGLDERVAFAKLYASAAVDEALADFRLYLEQQDGKPPPADFVWTENGRAVRLSPKDTNDHHAGMLLSRPGRRWVLVPMGKTTVADLDSHIALSREYSKRKGAESNVIKWLIDQIPPDAPKDQPVKKLVGSEVWKEHEQRLAAIARDRIGYPF